MKKIHLAIIFCLALFIFSCKQEVKNQSVEVKIEGMTCEIGCAKLIESKVKKIEGVKLSKVSFENKIGLFSFDSNITSINHIEKTINGIAGGELYKVTDVKSVENPKPINEVKK